MSLRFVPATEFITERHATTLRVRRPADPEYVEEIGEYVSREMIGDDPEPLLGLDGAMTASLFLDRKSTTPELVWYVELPDS